MYTMIKHDFKSELFNQTIPKNSENYASLVKAELLYRRKLLERNKCDCLECKEELEELKEYLLKLESSLPK